MLFVPSRRYISVPQRKRRVGGGTTAAFVIKINIFYASLPLQVFYVAMENIKYRHKGVVVKQYYGGEMNNIRVTIAIVMYITH